MPFVGRRRELDRLGAVLGAAAATGIVVLISGEPGVGKTALADEVARRASARGMTVLRAACYEEAGTGGPPLLLVHGFASNHHHLSPLFEHFRTSRRVVTVDRRGQRPERRARAGLHHRRLR